MEKSGKTQWHLASLIFDTLRHGTLQPDVVTCNSMIFRDAWRKKKIF